jgi:mono/diheme cytochrome c family protein
VAEQGKKVAQVNCVSCHGKAGKGDGAAAMALNPKPADWTSKKIQDESER